MTLKLMNDLKRSEAENGYFLILGKRATYINLSQVQTDLNDLIQELFLRHNDLSQGLEQNELLLLWRWRYNRIRGWDLGTYNLLIMSFVCMQLFSFQIPQSNGRVLRPSENILSIKTKVHWRDLVCMAFK